MKRVVLFKDDLANAESDPVQLGLSWNGLLESLGVEAFTLVDGKWINRQIESVEIVVQKTVASDKSGVEVGVVGE